jgi:pilus assembly protein FimV
VIVAEAPEDALAVDDVALASAGDAGDEEVVEDDTFGSPGDSLTSEDGSEEEGFELSTGEGSSDEEEVLAPDPALELAAQEPEAAPFEEETTTAENLTYPDEEPQLFDDPAALVTSEDPPLEDAPFETEPAAEEAVEAPPDEEPASEECDEASFFLDQGLTEEAREILETVTIAYPGHVRATELMDRLTAMEAGGGAASPSSTGDEEIAPPSVAPVGDKPAGETDAFDLAAELAGMGGEEELEAPPPPSSDDYQVSVDEVFSEFKKGLAKVVKPEDVETHYDLGIAYKEMGLLDDAINEFKVAREGCMGKKREVECLSMSGTLQGMKGDFSAAVEAFKLALASEHSQGEIEKALRYELAAAYDASEQPGKALFHFQKVQEVDPAYREVDANVSRLAEVASPEDDPIAPPAPPPAPRASKARKVGYL